MLKFYTLQNNGEIVSNPTYTLNRNRNLIHGILIYPTHGGLHQGEMSVLYRNYSQEGTNVVEERNTNLKNVFDANLTNIISVRFRYYLDYNMVKNKF
jgi:hypothetical protein